MTKGGSRKGAGSPLWSCRPTQSVRIPSVFVPIVLKITRILDNAESLNVAVEALSDFYSNFENFSLDYGNDNTKDIVGNDMSSKLNIDGLYYITHIDNVVSILNRGILSHSLINKEGISHKSVYNLQVVNKRANRVVIDDKVLWDYANLYFQPRNAMLYSLYRASSSSLSELVIISVSKRILNRKTLFITTGNAASEASKIIPISEAKEYLPSIRNSIDTDWWNNEDGSKRKIMAECLVPDKVSPSYISHIYVVNDDVKQKVEELILSSQRVTSNDVQVFVEPKRFFQPDLVRTIHGRLKIVKGDLFFSRAQTLTISVNCVGVMGKGLASTAKYRFPDVYVYYQDLCKSKELAYGKPSLYKRESSIFVSLYDEYSGLADIDSSSQTWFLLFPTKDHWKNKSNIDGIEEGLMWLTKNYKLSQIKSLAIPALGCGQGGLDWSVIGPLMCKYLVQIDIPVSIYLPTEKNIPNEQLSEDFLIQF